MNPNFKRHSEFSIFKFLEKILSLILSKLIIQLVMVLVELIKHMR